MKKGAGFQAPKGGGRGPEWRQQFGWMDMPDPGGGGARGGTAGRGKIEAGTGGRVSGRWVKKNATEASSYVGGRRNTRR